VLRRRVELRREPLRAEPLEEGAGDFHGATLSLRGRGNAFAMRSGT
jgi:hypothetical protein